MPEPTQFRHGKEFQKIVQRDYCTNSKGGIATAEVYIKMDQLEGIQKRTGRADILITELNDDFVSIIEIKATDWDRIKPANVRRNLSHHHRQLMKYIDKYLMIDQLDVCPAIIYPHPPRCPKLRKEIESRLDDYGTPAYWYSEVKTPSPENQSSI